MENKNVGILPKIQENQARILALDPSDTSEENLRALKALLSAKARKILYAGKTYATNGSSYVLKYHLVSAEEDKKKQPLSPRVYYVSKDEIGKGAYGIVYRNQGKLYVERSLHTELMLRYEIDDSTVQKHQTCKSTTALRLAKNEALLIPDNQLRLFILKRDYASYSKRGKAKFPEAVSVMDYIEGQDLSAYLNLFSPSGLKQEILIAEKIIHAYKEQVLDKGLIHRDIKPANLIYDTLKKKVRVIDFGFAIKKNQQDYLCVGTPWYMAPELIIGIQKSNVYSESTEVYALGKVFRKLFQSVPKSERKKSTGILAFIDYMIALMKHRDPTKRLNFKVLFNYFNLLTQYSLGPSFSIFRLLLEKNKIEKTTWLVKGFFGDFKAGKPKGIRLIQREIIKVEWGLQSFTKGLDKIKAILEEKRQASTKRNERTQAYYDQLRTELVLVQLPLKFFAPPKKESLQQREGEGLSLQLI